MYIRCLLTLPSQEAPYLLPSTAPTLAHSDEPPPYTVRLQIANDDLDLCFTMSDDAISQSAPEASSIAYFPNADNSPAPQYSDRYDPSYIESIQSFKSRSRHLGLQKIVEMENWESPADGVKVEEPQSPINRICTSFSPLEPSYLPCPRSCHSFSGMSRSASDNLQSRGNSDSSSHTEMPQLKRRQSSFGRPMPSPLTDAGFSLKLDKAGSLNFSAGKFTDNFDLETPGSEPEPRHKPKISAKASHSLVERKYRHNLNSKLDLLGQTIASSRLFKVDTDANNKTTSSKPPKAEVLNRAMRYVKRAELEGEAYIREIESLRVKVAAYEKLIPSRDWVHVPFASTEMPPLGNFQQQLQQQPPLLSSKLSNAHGLNTKSS